MRQSSQIQGTYLKGIVGTARGSVLRAFLATCMNCKSADIAEIRDVDLLICKNHVWNHGLSY